MGEITSTVSKLNYFVYLKSNIHVSRKAFQNQSHRTKERNSSHNFDVFSLLTPCVT